MDGIVRPRKRRWEVLEAFEKMRADYPDGRLYVIVDNADTHFTPEVETWCAANGTELVPTPTNASFLNPIEERFDYLDGLVLRNSDYGSHADLARMVHRGMAYIRRYPTPFQWKFKTSR
jgi:hypothetical protein